MTTTTTTMMPRRGFFLCLVVIIASSVSTFVRSAVLGIDYGANFLDFHRRAWTKSDYVGDKRDIEKKDHDSGEFCERGSMVRGRSDELPSSIPGESDDEVERTARKRRAVRFGFGL